MTRKEAIERKCIDCSGGWDVEGNVVPGVRAEIRDCLVGAGCPLYHFRPYQADKKPKRNLSEETKLKMAENLKRARAARSAKSGKN